VITSGRAASLISPLLCSLALGAVSTAALSHSPPGQDPTLRLSAGSCPLSVPNQVKAIKAFGAMMPVFRHPRCFNCHGGFDITSDEHEGSDFAKNSGLDPRSLLTVAQRKELHDACGTCHSNVRGTITRLDGTQLAGWLVAPLPMLWNGKSDEQLCLDMKRFERDGDQFIDHIETDHNEIQFIEAAFHGDRALSPQDLTQYGIAVEKPPGTQADLVAKARKWVAALDGIWKDPPECGCVKPKLELKMTSEWVGMGNGNSITHQVSATVPLEPDTSGLVFSGEAPLKHDRYTLSRLPGGCRITPHPSGGKLQVTQVRLDIGDDQRMGISLAIQRQAMMDGGNVGIACSRPFPVPTLPAIGWTGEWQFLHEQDLIGQEFHFDEFESASGRALAGERKLIGHKEVNRSKTYPQDLTMRAKTTFELWWVGP
jgi:hypothetical protein